MKQVIIFIGSGRAKGHTSQAAESFAAQLEQKGDITVECINLHHYDLSVCKGCINCFENGESRCPISDDMAALIEKMDRADGVVFATPNYAFHMSGMMKLFLDRLSYQFHRPRHFGKCSTSLVTQGFYKGGDIVKYFHFISGALGFTSLKGACLTTVEPIPEKVRIRNERAVLKLSEAYYKELMKPELPKANLFGMMVFRIGRTRVRKMLDESNADFRYYREKGWFTSDFYYDTPIHPLMKLWGRCIDILSNVMVKK